MARTTINVPQDTHKACASVKEEFDESWTDVLMFYAEHRADLEVTGTQDFAELKELLERVPERTADTFETKYR
jgi:hypothetical protein